MFGGTGSTTSKDGLEDRSIETISYLKNSEETSGEKGSYNGGHASQEKKGLGKASSLLASAKNSLLLNHSNLMSGPLKSHSEQNTQTPLQKLGKEDTALSVPQGQHNNSAGESHPGLRSTFTVGVWEDRNKKCRRTMEDTHAFLYNFLHTPAPNLETEQLAPKDKPTENNKCEEANPALENANFSAEMMETDNGYFAIFDGHAGTFAADWCGKKLHIILEQMIRTNPNIPIPELLDQTFTNVDTQLGNLPQKNSGCTAVTAILRWEDRIPNSQSTTGSIAIGPATIAALKEVDLGNSTDEKLADDGCSAKKISPTHINGTSSNKENTHIKLRSAASRHRVLYTANVGDARIILCRKGKALRLSYDHKGSDENEGKRVASAGGLILNNRVNGVLAVTRALGDYYMKDLVTGHPYTTETVIQPEMDEFIILACDGLWDVCSDQEAVNLIREIEDPTLAAKRLVDYALSRFSTDNLSCMIVRFNKSAHLTATTESDYAIGVEGDPTCMPGKISEAEKIVGEARRKVIEDGVPGIGISGSNFGNGHDSKLATFSGEEKEKKIYQVAQEPGSNKI